MKKLLSIFLSLVSLICFTFAFGGCGEMEFNDNLPFKTALVSIDYSDKETNKANLSIGNETEKFNLSGYELYNKSNRKKVKRLVGGDRLEIYYSEENSENIDHVLVKKAKALTLLLYSETPPGGASKDVYSQEDGVAVNTFKYGVYYAIDKSGNYVSLTDVDSNTQLYGTYIEEEVEEKGLGVRLHYIHALYLYNPN